MEVEYLVNAHQFENEIAQLMRMRRKPLIF